MDMGPALSSATAWLTFLEAAAALARRQFTQFDLRAIVLGCLLAVACVLLQAGLAEG